MRLACSRAKQLNLTSRKVASLLLETTGLYDSYGQALVQAAVGLKAAEEEEEQAGDHAAAIRSIVNGVGAQGVAYRKIAKQLRQNVKYLQKFLVTHGDAAINVQDRFQACCSTASQTHQKVVTAQKVYESVESAAARALAEWKQQRNGTNSGGAGDTGDEQKTDAAARAPTAPPFPKHIVAKLSQVQACQARHKRLLGWELECIRQRQRLEVMALETMQKLEEDRCVILVQSLIKSCLTVAAVVVKGGDPASSRTEREDMDGASEEGRDSSAASPSVNATRNSPVDSWSKPDGAGLSIQRTPSFPLDMKEDEGSGVMDCDTLGLPLDIGELRDRVRAQASARAASVQTARLLSEFLDDVTAASKTFGDSLNEKLHTSGEKSNSVSYSSVGNELVSAGDGARITELWGVLSKSLEKQARAAFSLAKNLTSLRHEKLDHVIEYGDRTLEPAIKRDEATWKQLCDAARGQTRAEEQFIEATTQSARVRERCKSVDSTSAGASFTNRHVSQSLANMFSILPNGGEHAMKVLDASTRASVAKLSLNDANQKETRERQLLESKIAFRDLSLEAYKAYAETALKEFEKTDPIEYAPFAALLISCVEVSRDPLNDADEDAQKALTVRAWVGVHASLDTWLSFAREELNSLQTDYSGEPTQSVRLSQSETVRQALTTLQENAGEPPIELDESMIDETTESEAYDDTSFSSTIDSPLRERTGSASSLGALSKSQNDEKQTNWLMRSLTMPEGSDSIFGKWSVKKALPRMRQPKYDNFDTESSIFATFFWPETVDAGTIPSIVKSAACSFRDGGKRFPSQYGRLFLTNGRLLFVSWTRKQLNLKWSEVVSMDLIENSVTSLEDSVVVKCRKGSADESYIVLSGFYDRRGTIEMIENIRKLARTPQQPSPSSTPPHMPTLLPQRSADFVPADKTLEKMDKIVSRAIRSTSIQQFYNIVWSEEQPFYRSWLEKECFDVEVSDWIVKEATASWCGEKYNQTRTVKFKMKRKTHLYIGPPVAQVTQVR